MVHLTLTVFKHPKSAFEHLLHSSFTCFLSAFLHACRALAVCAVITGFFGGVLTLVGMKCTKIGGSEIANARVTFAGGITYLVSGINLRKNLVCESYALRMFKGVFPVRILRHDHLLMVGQQSHNRIRGS